MVTVKVIKSLQNFGSRWKNYFLMKYNKRKDTSIQKVMRYTKKSIDFLNRPFYKKVFEY